MAANTNLIKSADVAVTARIIDFTTSFARNFESLRQVMGITRPIPKQSGTALKAKKAVGTLESGSVAEGDLIPRSHYSVQEVDMGTITIEKYSKEVSIEAISDHGYDAAVAMTDSEFLVSLQDNVTSRFYTYLASGTLTDTATSFQMAFAKAIGSVKNKFKTMHKDITGVVVFCNLMDFYEYLGSSDITLQTAFGMTYVQNFMGADTVFLCSDNEVASGKIIATPVNNLVCYYVNPEDSDFAKAGLNYQTDGETNLIGFAIKPDYDRATSVDYAIMGMTLFAEYIDGIAVVTVGE